MECLKPTEVGNSCVDEVSKRSFSLKLTMPLQTYLYHYDSEAVLANFIRLLLNK